MNLKEKRTLEQLETTLSALCIYIKAELKNTSGVQTESILPEMIEATTHLADLVLNSYR